MTCRVLFASHVWRRERVRMWGLLGRQFVRLNIPIYMIPSDVALSSQFNQETTYEYITRRRNFDISGLLTRRLSITALLLFETRARRRIQDI